MPIPLCLPATQVPLPNRLIQGLLAVPLLLLAGWLAWTFPIGRYWLLALGLALGLWQWCRPSAWLIAIPVLVPVLQLGPWSGRVLLDELDICLAMIAAAALLAGQYNGGGVQMMRRSYLVLWLLGLAVLVGLGRGLLPLAPLDANAWSGYLTRWNALRVSKGLLWAMLYWPLLTAQLHRERVGTEQALTIGMTLGAIAFGIAVLWERGFFADLVTATNIWGLVASWLNLQSRYRITGLFTQMHFGGAAVDGFIVLIWPFALLLLLRARRPQLIGLGAIGLLLAAYACLVTFTRTTYIAVATGAAVALLPLLLSTGAAQRRVTLTALGLTMLMAVAGWLGFTYGGVLVIAGYSAILLAAAAIGYAAGRLRQAVQLGLVATVCMAGLLLALRGILTSKYHDTGLATALALTLPVSTLAGFGAWYLGRSARGVLQPRLAAVAALGIALIPPIVAMGLGGTRMEIRLGSLDADAQKRLDHWTRVWDSMSKDPWSLIFGQGTGRYPITYLSNPLGARTGVMVWADGNVRLAGSSQLHIGQRIADLPPGRYRVEAHYRALSGSAALVAQLARRPLLVQEWFGTKTETKLPSASSKDTGPDHEQWQERSVWINATKLGANPWYRPRYWMFSFWLAGGSGSVIEVDRISVYDEAGRALLENPGFGQDTDHWLAYNDYEHLALHAKNLALIVFFDQGALGLLAWVMVLGVAISRSWHRARRGAPFPPAALAAMIGFLTLGSTSTLLDVPRLALLVGLLLAAMLYRPRHRLGRQRKPAAEGPQAIVDL